MAAVIKLDKVGAQVNWPKEERIPTTLSEALDSGWEISGGATSYDDGFTEIGEAWLHKAVGAVALHLCIPYRATLRYGKPHTPTARVITETRHFNAVGKHLVELRADCSGNGGVN